MIGTMEFVSIDAEVDAEEDEEEETDVDEVEEDCVDEYEEDEYEGASIQSREYDPRPLSF
jgi:hypothetical protein